MARGFNKPQTESEIVKNEHTAFTQNLPIKSEIVYRVWFFFLLWISIYVHAWRKRRIEHLTIIINIMGSNWIPSFFLRAGMRKRKNTHTHTRTCKRYIYCIWYHHGTMNCIDESTVLLPNGEDDKHHCVFRWVMVFYFYISIIFNTFNRSPVYWFVVHGCKRKHAHKWLQLAATTTTTTTTMVAAAAAASTGEKNCVYFHGKDNDRSLIFIFIFIFVWVYAHPVANQIKRLWILIRHFGLCVCVCACAICVN